MSIISGTDRIKPGFAAGDLLTIPTPPVFKTASHIGSLQDIGKLIFMDSASANTFTVPSDARLRESGNSEFQAYWPGAAFFVWQLGAGQTSFVADPGVTLVSESSFVAISAQYLSAIAYNLSPNRWLLAGRLA